MPIPLLIGGYADPVLKRTAVNGDGWLTYFYRPADFKKSQDKIVNCREGGKDPSSAFANCVNCRS